MKVKKRHELIIEALRKKKKISVDELSEQFDVSHETMRRDLSQLANKGKLQKIHGGAVLPRILEEGSSFLMRMAKNTDAKIRIAECATKLFKQNETLFIVTGSTTIFFAEKVLNSNLNLRVITNSIEIAQIIAEEPKNQVFLLGGQYNHDNRQTVSAMVLGQIQEFRSHHVVLSIAALSESGAWDLNLEEAQIAQAFIKQAASVTVLVDSSKYDTLATFKVCSLSEIDRIICDVAPPQSLLDAIEKADVEVIVAKLLD